MLKKRTENFVKRKIKKKKKKSSKGPTQYLREAIDPSVDLSTIYGSFNNILCDRVTVNYPLRNRNWELRMRYAQLHKNWTENQWQRVLWSDETS